MKKLLLTLAVVLLGLSASAADKTVDFGTLTEAIAAPTSGTTNFTLDDIVFTLENSNSSINVTSSKGYVMLKNNTGAISFNLPFECTSIIVTTTSGCSTNAGNKLTLTVAETKIEEKAVNATNSDFTFNLGTAGVAGAKCTFTASGTKNSQIQKLTFKGKTDEASIEIEEKSLSFAAVLNGEVSKTFKVNVQNITEDLTVASDNANFTVAAKATVAEAAAGIPVTFKGTSTETVTGNITVTAGSISATIPVSGFAVAHAGTEALSVSDVIKLNNLLAGTYYVKGTIGDKCAANAKNGVIQETEDLTDSNIILKEGDDAIGVALPAGETRTKLNIKDNPTNVGQTIIITGSLEAYFSAPGVKNAVYVSGLAESTLKAAELKFSETTVNVELGAEFVEPTLTKETTADVTYSTSNEEVAKVDATTGKVEIIAAGTATITAKAEENEEYQAGTASYTIKVTAPVAKATVALATSMSTGKYAIYTEKGVAMNFTGNATATYGYLYLEEVTVENNEFEVNEDYLIEFTDTDKGYTMLDSRGKYLGMDASHFGSFNFYDTPDADGSNCYWTITFDGNNAKIVNAGRAGAYLSYKEYNGQWELATTDTADMPAIQLYKVKDTEAAISEIEAVEEGAVEYYNLQGVRVANPEAGLYIRRQGSKATKVYVK